MSRLFPEQLLAGLSSAEVSLARVRGALRARVVEQRTFACDPGFGQEPWQGAVAALKSVPVGAACRVTVLLSNEFVRYAVVPWSDALSGPAEEDAYLRHHFAKVYGERARSWSLRSSEAPSGAPRLASAVDRALIDALQGCFPKGGKAKLVSVQPYLMAAVNRWRDAIPKGGAWLVLAEPERACIALHARGAWRSVQNAKGPWLAALERERHRVEGEVPDLVLLAGAPAGAEAAGWRLRELKLDGRPLALAA